MPSEGPSFRSPEKDAYYRRTLGAVDLGAALVAVIVATQVFGAGSLRPGILLCLPLVVLISKVAGLYERDELLLNKTTLEEMPALFQAATFYTLVIWLFERYLVTGHLHHVQVVGLWGLLFLFLVSGRAAVRKVLRVLLPAERCLVLGDAPGAERVALKLAGSHAVKARIVGRVAFEPEAADGRPSSVPLLGSLDGLGLIIADHEVDRVVIAPGSADQDTILDAIRLIKTLAVKVSVMPRLLEVIGSSVEFDAVDGMALLGVRRFGLTASSHLLKRGMDLAGAVLGLLVLSPLLAALAAAVKLTSPGPVFFRQRRVGRGGEEFEMVKFRTMVDGAEALKPDLRELNEAQGIFKIRSDPRLTPIGHALRKTCLDELPQLWNVLKGDMSLVGPRPLVPDEDCKIEGWNRRRLHMSPGMTGFWQISGSSRIPLQEMVTIDYLYGANWSLWGDIKILVRTLAYMAARRGM
jgi:exopolysaccharide biosynthesis polyprenyl glycosylphosphotransferase